MSDIIKFPHPVSGCRTEYCSGKSRLIVDACQLSADLYEVITMRPRGEEVELASESYAATDDIAIVTIENGRVLERTWTFLPEHQESGRFPAGVYHLRLEYYDSVEVIENFLEIPAEQPA